MRDTKMTSSQLAAAKKQLIGQIGVASDNFENNALGMAKTYLHYHKYESSELVFKRIEALTAEQLLEVSNEMFADDYNNIQTLWTSVKLINVGTYNKIKDYENVGSSSDNTHGNVHFEKGETKTITLYYLITDEEFENETLAIDFHYYGSPCKGTLAIVHEP